MTTSNRKKCRRTSSSVAAFAAASLLTVLGSPAVGAFHAVPVRTTRQAAPSSSPLFASPVRDGEDSIPSSRREVLRTAFGGFFSALVASSAMPGTAEASYSAYTNREKDWEARQKNGEVQYSSARALRAQLQEIAPMNSEGSKVFCPNGPSAAVSPLMENKCGDRLAMPSVYGRQDDTVGNSIPGFKGGRYPSAIPGDSSSLSAGVGGFPNYGGTEGKEGKLLQQMK